MDASGHLQGRHLPLSKKLGGPLSISVLSGEEPNILPLPGIEARLFGCPSRN